MSLVVDASVLVTAILSHDVAAERLRERLRQIASWVAPHHIDLECMSAWRSMFLRGLISRGDFTSATEYLTDAPIRRYATWGLNGRIQELAPSVSIYDGAYVALAEISGLTLLTCDQRLARASGPRCEFEVAC